MDREQIISIIRAHEAELRARGIVSLSLFGSAARGGMTDKSDIDVAAKMRRAEDHTFSNFAEITEFLSRLLGTEVDFVTEPVRMKQRLQAEIDRDRVRAF